MTILLIALGCLPFAFGGVLNWYMLQYVDTTPPLFLIGVLFLVLWSAIAFLMWPRMESTRKTVLWLHLAALLVLILLGVQELIVGAYWSNAVGLWTQLFYLPVIPIGFSLTMWSGSMLPAYLVSFGLMAVVSVIGCNWRKILSK